MNTAILPSQLNTGVIWNSSIEKTPNQYFSNNYVAEKHNSIVQTELQSPIQNHENRSLQLENLSHPLSAQRVFNSGVNQSLQPRPVNGYVQYNQNSEQQSLPSISSLLSNMQYNQRSPRQNLPVKSTVYGNTQYNQANVPQTNQLELSLGNMQYNQNSQYQSLPSKQTVSGNNVQYSQNYSRQSVPIQSTVFDNVQYNQNSQQQNVPLNYRVPGNMQYNQNSPQQNLPLYSTAYSDTQYNQTNGQLTNYPTELSLFDDLQYSNYNDQTNSLIQTPMSDLNSSQNWENQSQPALPNSVESANMNISCLVRDGRLITYTKTDYFYSEKNTSVSSSAEKETPLSFAPKRQRIENNSDIPEHLIGGFYVGRRNVELDDVEDDLFRNVPDGKRVKFKKLNNIVTFPSLVVRFQFNLEKKFSCEELKNREKMLKKGLFEVLTRSPASLCHWIQGRHLLPISQFCTVHSTDEKKVFLLENQSESIKCPYSANYYWRSPCCPHRFVSIYNGSIFQDAPYQPTVILKLMFYWARQTTIEKVVQSLKITHTYVKKFYTLLRGVCIAAIQDKNSLIGSKFAAVQVAIITLGNSSPNSVEHKYDILGVFDTQTRNMRLRAFDIKKDDRINFEYRLKRVLESLRQWVDKDAEILIDNIKYITVLQELGFSKVTQTPSDISTMRTYLCRTIPVLFKYSLNYFDVNIIQQFLDELAWRDRYGQTTGEALDNIIRHTAEQTRACEDNNLIERLMDIAENPNADWRYSEILSS